MFRTLFLSVVLGLSAVPASAQSPPAPPAAPAAGETPSVDWLLDGLNDNLNSDTRSTTFTMTVVNPRRTKEYVITSYSRGNDEAVLEYLQPAREKGTKYLRRGGELWMYMPRIERTQKISGHMLRQGMGGSDMSYEDMTSSTDWRADYTGEVLGSEVVEGRPHYKVALTATRDDVTYHTRVIWVDAETRTPSKQDMYALSGLMVKRWQMSDIRRLEDGRYYPFAMRIEDSLTEGTYTDIVTTDLQLGVPVEDEVFSLRWLERK